MNLNSQLGGRRWLIAAAGILCLAAVSLVDYVTPTESLFTPFYFLPVSFCAWYLGRSGALGMALASGVVWWLVDKLSGNHYAHETYRYWNAFMCFLSSVTAGLLLARLKTALVAQAKLEGELAKMREDYRGLAEKLQALQAGEETRRAE